MHKKLCWLAAASILVICVAVAFADDWNVVRALYETCHTKYDDLRKLTPVEAKRLVTAVCEADEDERKTVGKEASERVAKLVKEEYDALTVLYDDARAKLTEVINDRSLAAHHADATAYRLQVKKWGETIELMTRWLRGKNHPAVRYTIDQGNKAHRDRQSSKECDVSEYKLGENRVDCIRASDCTVVELKPDNEKGMKRGRKQVEDYVALLNDDEKERKKLATRNSDFNKCQRFEWEVWCYKLCPGIDEETGDMIKVEATWRKCVSP